MLFVYYTDVYIAKYIIFELIEFREISYFQTVSKGKNINFKTNLHNLELPC